MLDDYIDEQKISHRILSNCLKKNKISHAYLIETNNYIKAFDFALSFAKSLACPNNYTNNTKCNNCKQCERIDHNNFSEIKIIEPDGLWIKKEQLSNLQKEFSTKSVESKYNIYIIKDAEKLNQAAANSILKFLEEPEDNIIAILLTNNIYQMLSTIISRCQVIKLKPIFENNLVYESIFKNNEDEETKKEIINNVINFILKYEKEKINTLLFTQSIWHEYFKDKDKVLIGFEIMILFYKEVLSYMINGIISNFNEYEKQIKSISLNNKVFDITKKIQILLDLKEKIYYNINNQLLIDKLIIEWEK